MIEIAEQFRTRTIPLDAIYLDIMYMNGYRVFSFDPNRFQKAPKMIERLMAAGVRTVPIVDPGIKVEDQYRVYQQGLSQQYFIESSELVPWQGMVWPGLAYRYGLTSFSLKFVFGGATCINITSI